MANTVDKVINIALAEEGYLEKSKEAYLKNPSILDKKTEGAGNDNYTKYGRDMHKIYPSVMDFPAPWCDAWCDWCFYKAYGVTTAKSLIGGNFDDYTVKSAEMYLKKKALDVIPAVGAQVFFTRNKNVSGCYHTGLVYKVDGTYFYTIEGNTSASVGVIRNGGGVAKKKYRIADYNGKVLFGHPKYDEEKPQTTDNTLTIWNYLKGKGLNDYAIAGLMGNLYAESSLNPRNLQNSCESRLGMTDDLYTAAVDNGTYGNFAGDQAGYGLAQWTSSGRKQGLLNYVRSKNCSIGDLMIQLEYLWNELNGYKSVMKVLNNASSVREASDAVLTGYERPKDQSEKVKTTRAGYGQRYFDKYASSTPDGYEVAINTGALNVRKEPDKDAEITAVVRRGETYTIIGETTDNRGYKWGKLKSGIGWISLMYTVRR